MEVYLHQPPPKTGGAQNTCPHVILFLFRAQPLYVGPCCCHVFQNQDCILISRQRQIATGLNYENDTVQSIARFMNDDRQAIHPVSCHDN